MPHVLLYLLSGLCSHKFTDQIKPCREDARDKPTCWHSIANPQQEEMYMFLQQGECLRDVHPCGHHQQYHLILSSSSCYTIAPDTVTELSYLAFL